MRFRLFLPYIFFSTAVFIASFILGYQAAVLSPDVVDIILGQLQEKFSPLANSRPIHIFAFIFLNNTLIDLVMILTFFLVGLVPLLILFSNGLMIGVVVSALGQEQGLAQTTTLLVPHGVLEIPSFLVAAGVSLWLGIQFIKKLFQQQPFKPAFLLAMRVFFFVVVPLNLLAAFIETYITPLIYTLRFPS